MKPTELEDTLENIIFMTISALSTHSLGQNIPTLV